MLPKEQALAVLKARSDDPEQTGSLSNVQQEKLGELMYWLSQHDAPAEVPMTAAQPLALIIGWLYPAAVRLDGLTWGTYSDGALVQVSGTQTAAKAGGGGGGGGMGMATAAVQQQLMAEMEDRVMDRLGNRMERMMMHQSTTIVTLSTVGKNWMSKSEKVQLSNLSFYTAFGQDVYERCAAKVKAEFPGQLEFGRVLAKKGQLDPKIKYSGMSLADAAWEECMKGNWREDSGVKGGLDQQKLNMKIISAIHSEVNDGDVCLKETNSNTSMLHHPEHRPDLTTLAEMALQPTWSQIVGFFEWKLYSNQEEQVFGQLIQRCSALLDQQCHQDRKVVFAVGMTTGTLLVLEVKKSEEQLVVRHTDWLPLSICPNNQGFQLLVQVLAAKKHLLGYKPPTFPPIKCFETEQGDVEVLFKGILKERTRPGESFVFFVSAAGQDAVVKLNQSDTELICLKRLENMPHIVPLRGVKKGCEYLGEQWTAILLGCWVQRLTCEDSLPTFSKVASGVTSGISLAAGSFVLHRDVTPSNFGHVDEQGIIFDWSSSKVFESQEHMDKAERSEGGAPSVITGTMLHCPLPILLGHQHTMSTQLDGLFISLLYISCGGKVLGRKLRGTDLDAWTAIRRQQFCGGLCEPEIASHLKPFITDLYNLFWEPLSYSLHKYVDTVTAEQFQAVCTRHFT
mmetsp:Transcript_7857/g.13520  ORF Transcript_7857/g.13520 Transcript_7857/m.13520 type:complete len:679 (-) Transcript_7857:719-2755(-)